MVSRGRAKRHQVAQRFQTGQNFHGVALIFREIVAVELIEFEAGTEKMIVVHQRVFARRTARAKKATAVPRRVRRATRRRGARQNVFRRSRRGG